MRNDDISILLHELTADAWAMEPGRLHTLFARLGQIAGQNLMALPTVQIAVSEPKVQIREDGTAVVPIKGILTKEELPAWMSIFGIVGTSYGRIRRMIAEAAASEKTQRIELRIESPGGQVSGVAETAEAIAAAAKDYEVTATVEDLAASAAYWLASQADTITANPNAFIGSIGVYTVYGDWSKFAADLGVTIHVIRSGEHKGMGVMGAPITEAQIAAMQENIDRIAAHFTDAVASGRGWERDKAVELSTGRLWEATAAAELGLIDAVTMPTTLGATAQTTKPTTERDQPMKDQEQKAEATVDIAAVQSAERKRMADLRAAFPKDLEFAMTQFEAGATLTEAKAAYADVLSERLAAKDKEPAKGATNAAMGADGRIGQAHAEGNESQEDGPDFLAVSRQYAAEHKCTMASAMQAVQSAQPDLHQRFLDSAEAQARPRKKSGERIEA